MHANCDAALARRAACEDLRYYSLLISRKNGGEIERGWGAREAEQAEIYISFATLDASRRSRVAASIIEKQVVVYRSGMSNIAALVLIVSVERRACNTARGVTRGQGGGQGEQGCRDIPLRADGAPGPRGPGCTISVISFFVQCQLRRD